MQPHFLLVTFPAQGHINPALELGKRLVKLGSHVTFVTSTFAYRQMAKGSHDGLLAVENVTFATYSDGYDDGKPESVPPHLYMKEIRRQSSLTLPKLIESSAQEGHPVTLLIYSLLLPWAAEVARELDVPSALLWIQPAALLAVYCHYFNEKYSNMFDEVIVKGGGHSSSVELPGLPPLTKFDMPSHFVTTKFALSGFQEHLKELRREAKPMVLINTFDALEPEALAVVNKEFQTIAIGPLIPSEYLNNGVADMKSTSVSCDLFADNWKVKYMNFLDSNKKGSVVYISFGSTSVLPKTQMEEIINGLLASPFSFLWVVREAENVDIFSQFSDKWDELEKHGGMVVPWCSQMQVLSHPSVGCFLTHCGWNSTAESIACGVPVIAFPQWADQPTNSKLAEDVWKIGVRMKANEDGVVVAEEVRKSIEKVMMGEDESMVQSVKKWMEAAKAAVRSDGSSDVNLKRFLQNVMGG